MVIERGGVGGMKMDWGGLTDGAVLLGCSEDSIRLYWFSVNSLIQFHYLKLLCKHEHTACSLRSSGWEERLSKALGNHSKHSPTIPVWGKAGLQSGGISLGPGVPGGHRALAAPLCHDFALVLHINPEAGRTKLSQTFRRAHSKC